MPAMGDIAGIILAGGRARRMGGGDKVLRPLGRSTILDHVVALARPQVAALALSANGDPRRFERFGLPVLPDGVPDFPGPLAGLLAGLEWAAALSGATHLASFAGDSPIFPADLVCRLVANAGSGAACAASGGRLHPVFGLWPVAARDELRRALVVDGLRRVEDWARRVGAVVVDFPAPAGRDPFFNVNRPEDLAAAETMLAGPA